MGNALLFLWPPAPKADQPAPLGCLPHPQKAVGCLGATYAEDILRLARLVLAHEFPLFAATVPIGDKIAWRRDYTSGIESGTRYFRRIPYLDYARVGDHKIIWELNRHQHLVLLAQAFCINGDEEFLDEIRREIDSWITANPYMRGINWSSALEVAFRALSWLWVYHLTGARMDQLLRERFLTALYRHGLYIEHNLSIYFSPNTHLLGEAVALHALGVLLPGFPRAREWQQTGSRIVREQMDFQVRPDGSHFEQSSYYHVYALDMFLFHYLLAGRPPAFRTKLTAMAEYLHSLLGPSGSLPFLGDDDGGRFFHPYGPRERFGRATLATCASLFERPGWLFAATDWYEQAAWWIGPASNLTLASPETAAWESRFFPEAGIACMCAGDVHVIADAGPFGFAGAGHSHSDTLSLTARLGAEEILIDPGTFTYVGAPKWRDWFRSSRAHSTICIDGADQSVPLSPFRWGAPPEISVPCWESKNEYDFLDAACGYRRFNHRRQFLFLKPRLLFILDEITGPAGDHQVEQFWHAGSPVRVLGPRQFQIGSRVRLFLAEPSLGQLTHGGEYGWRAPVFGRKEEAFVIRVAMKSPLPLRLEALLDFSGEGDPEDAWLWLSRENLRGEGFADSVVNVIARCKASFSSC